MRYLKLILPVLIIFTLSACLQNYRDNATTNEEGDMDKSTDTSLSDGEYIIDAENSLVRWKGQNVVGKTHTGTVVIKSGSFKVENGVINGGMLTVDMTSIKSDEGIERLEKHLSSEDFFSVEKYPESVLKISSIQGGELKGLLTIKGHEDAVEFDVDVTSINPETISISSSFEIDRTVWDVRYGSGKFFDNLGDNMIRDRIGYEIELVAKK